ncbi:uncharacterized protein V1516DRAFT_677802 [Lipomyces oligophaga]|uniref:uncharacterized protein n=1 Tax=Lipomyces oligophaga TaxID=45792 RepID=UPI0034CDAEAE
MRIEDKSSADSEIDILSNSNVKADSRIKTNIKTDSKSIAIQDYAKARSKRTEIDMEELFGADETASTVDPSSTAESTWNVKSTISSPTQSLNKRQKLNSKAKDGNGDGDDVVPIIRPVYPHAPAPHDQRQKFARILAEAIRRTKTSRTPNKDASEMEFKVASTSSKAVYPHQIRAAIKSVERK